MTKTDHRKYPRTRVAVPVVVSPNVPKPLTATIDLSEGGTCLDWSFRKEIVLGTPVHLSFRLEAGQTIELVGRVVRVDGDRAGIEFLPEQQDVIRQLLAEARSDV